MNYASKQWCSGYMVKKRKKRTGVRPKTLGYRMNGPGHLQFEWVYLPEDERIDSFPAPLTVTLVKPFTMGCLLTEKIHEMDRILKRDGFVRVHKPKKRHNKPFGTYLMQDLLYILQGLNPDFMIIRAEKTIAGTITLGRIPTPKGMTLQIPVGWRELLRKHVELEAIGRSERITRSRQDVALSVKILKREKKPVAERPARRKKAKPKKPEPTPLSLHSPVKTVKVKPNEMAKKGAVSTPVSPTLSSELSTAIGLRIWWDYENMESSSKNSASSQEPWHPTERFNTALLLRSGLGTGDMSGYSESLGSYHSPARAKRRTLQTKSSKQPWNRLRSVLP